MNNTMKDEMQSHLWGNIAPFWLGLIDREYGGFYGLLTYDLKLDKKAFLDKENGGVYWLVEYDGEPADDTKHTYNQAFAIYALSSYFDATKDAEALCLAHELRRIVETKCRDRRSSLTRIIIRL